MIQFKRGKTNALEGVILADGQPGYDRSRQKIKIGDGKTPWEDLPDASGLRADEILDSEENAKEKAKALKKIPLIGPLLAKLARPIITYGTATPNKDTAGQLYLQYYDAHPETDYIVSSGADGNWTYQIWNTGFARCYGKYTLRTPISNDAGSAGLYINANAMPSLDYPFTFTKVPSEIATVGGMTGKIVWLAGNSACTKTTAGKYSLLSFNKQEIDNYEISISVAGYIDVDDWLDT